MFITPAAFPPVANAQSGLRTTLTNQLALQVGKLFQDLFPIAIDFNYEAALITDQQTLQNRITTLTSDVTSIKVTILTYNQLVTSGLRIPTDWPIGDSTADPTAIAGLNDGVLPNDILNSIDNLLIDFANSDFTAAQSDYATLRDLLIPYLAL